MVREMIHLKASGKMSMEHLLFLWRAEWNKALIVPGKMWNLKTSQGFNPSSVTHQFKTSCKKKKKKDLIILFQVSDASSGSEVMVLGVELSSCSETNESTTCRCLIKGIKYSVNVGSHASALKFPDFENGEYPSRHG